MSESVSNSTSRTNWAEVDSLSDEEIDTSDAPALGEEFFRRAKWRLPKPASTPLQPDRTPLLKIGDKVRLKAKPARSGYVVRQPRRHSGGYEYLVVIDGAEDWYSETVLDLAST